jgi:ribokinase
MINVDRRGENAITVVAGANGRLTPEDIRRQEPLIASARMMLLQLEIDYQTVASAIAVARRHGVPIMLDPAPAPGGDVPAEFWQVDYLTPNETEAERGPRNIVLKMGARGALVRNQQGIVRRVEPFPVQAVDSTAAGDAFNAALALALCGDAAGDLAAAVRFACAAGAFAASRRGAQPSMPTRQQVEAILSSG